MCWMLYMNSIIPTGLWSLKINYRAMTYKLRVRVIKSIANICIRVNCLYCTLLECNLSSNSVLMQNASCTKLSWLRIHQDWWMGYNIGYGSTNFYLFYLKFWTIIKKFWRWRPPILVMSHQLNTTPLWFVSQLFIVITSRIIYPTY